MTLGGRLRTGEPTVAVAVRFRSSRQQILQAARELGFSVVPEGGMAFYWNLDQMADGHTTIEHNLPVAPVYDDVLQWFAAR